MGLTADHISKLGLSVGQPVMVVKGGEQRPGCFRSYVAGFIYIEHDRQTDQSLEVQGRPDREHVIYRCEELDDLYTITGKESDDDILRWLGDEDIVDRSFIREAMRRRYGGE